MADIKKTSGNRKLHRLYVCEGSVNGTIQLAGPNILTIDNLIMTDTELAKITLPKGINTPLLLNGEEVGVVPAVMCPIGHPVMEAHFRYGFGGDDTATIADNLFEITPYLIAVGKFRAKLLGCMICGGWFTCESAQCGCMVHSKVLGLRDVELISVDLYDTRSSDVETLDARALLIAEHFDDIRLSMDLDFD